MFVAEHPLGANACLPSAAHVRQAAFAQSPPLPWSQPFASAVMEHSGPPA